MALLSHKTKSKALAILIILCVAVLLLSTLCNVIEQSWKRHMAYCHYTFPFPESRELTTDAAVDLAWRVVHSEGYVGYRIEYVRAPDPTQASGFSQDHWGFSFRNDADQRRNYSVTLERKGDQVVATGYFGH